MYNLSSNYSSSRKSRFLITPLERYDTFHSILDFFCFQPRVSRETRYVFERTHREQPLRISARVKVHYRPHMSEYYRPITSASLAFTVWGPRERKAEMWEQLLSLLASPVAKAVGVRSLFTVWHALGMPYTVFNEKARVLLFW